MKRLTAIFLILASATAADTQVGGTWEGKTNDLPSVELTIRQHKSEIQGTISFYFQTRGDDGKWRLGEKTTLPMLSPALAGNVLTFESIHHKKHGGPELGPNNKYRVRFVDAREARLQIIREGGVDPGPGFQLIRRE